jgi:signal transduction histidine kinase
MNVHKTELKRRVDGRGFFSELRVEFLVHELKDPIAVIETGVRALLEKTDKYGPITERQAKTLNRILRSTRKTREMLYELLEVGRSEAGYCDCGRFEPVHVVREVLADVLETLPGRVPEELRSVWNHEEAIAFLADLGIRLSVESQVMNTEMEQDETKFRQIVGNLLKNGLYHRRQVLEVRLERQAPAMLCVSVADDGPGIDPKHHRVIFERYAQVDECAVADRKGHGLGLAGALALARCLGGEIVIDSKKGKGATFRLTLPLVLEAEGG